ncbi:uncharacterized protein LOC129610802 [Condylostylus longicornis]|uniref:uncharacterized protein LOC129610802 n=1 Tax=Condylostylus longicornis TaxID=2530218 RepID=UPI00244DD4F9|nr:uncharacterized protein LOC129610802 [Condylostylus longicornis]
MLGHNQWRFFTIIAGLLLANAIDTPAKHHQNSNHPIRYTLYTTQLPYLKSPASYTIAKFTNRDLRKIPSSTSSIVKYQQQQKQLQYQHHQHLNLERRNIYVASSSPPSSLDLHQQQKIESTTPYAQQYIYIAQVIEPTSPGPINNRKNNSDNQSIQQPNQAEQNQQFQQQQRNQRNSRDTQEEESNLSGRRIGFQFPLQISSYDSPFLSFPDPTIFRNGPPIAQFSDNNNNGGSGGVGNGELLTATTVGVPITFPSGFDIDNRFPRQLIFDDTTGTLPGNIQVEFPGSVVANKAHSNNGKIFRDELTKFIDLNGPLGQRGPNRGLFFTDDFRSGGPGRPFLPAPQKMYVEYNDFPGQLKTSRGIPFKSSRTPRVVFPASDNVGGSGSGVYSSDTVAFRDQNFGLNELSAIQDVRNEFTLQDINNDNPSSAKPDSSSSFNEKGDITTELQCQHQGGTCEFFLVCWMSTGLIRGTCGGILQGCCHRTAKSSNLGTSDYVNAVDLTDLPHKTYGPTINDASCGISLAKQTAQRRIVGGDDAGFGNFPWQAYIRIGSSRCGGSLVSRKHVVTAGHCVARASPRQVHVTLGDYVINSAVEPLPAYTFGVRRIDVHPYFKFTPQADRFDISVLTLERPVHFMPHIAPLCLPEKNEDFLGKFGWSAGWGALNPGSRLRPKTLQAVDVPVIENRVCERWHRSNGINVVIYPEMMCAGYRNGGKDSCQGDSGGPLMHEKNGRWYLIGVVSAGYSCASRGQPGIYHRVPYTVDWISYVIGLTS